MGQQQTTTGGQNPKTMAVVPAGGGSTSATNSSYSLTSSLAQYFVDSLEGCTLLTMLVEHVAAKLPQSLVCGEDNNNSNNSSSNSDTVAAAADDSSSCPSQRTPRESEVQQQQQKLLSPSPNDVVLKSESVLGQYNKKEAGEQQRDRDGGAARIGARKTRTGAAHDDGQGSSTSGDDRSLDNVPLDDEFENFELADLKTVATLGIGGFGRVNLVRHINRDQAYALKILNKRHVKNQNQVEHVQSERSILLECRCDFIVRLYKTFRDSERVYMLMEYCPGGDLWTMLRSLWRLDEKAARYFCAAALEAFDYLHQRTIIYRDLKPENMLLDINGVPKLVDFGFAKRLSSDSARAWTFCGTAEYVAPEVILGEGQDSAVDIWSLGIFLYELLSGSPPFAASEAMLTYSAILKGVQLLAWPRYISENSRSIICKLCRRKAVQRLGYDRIDDIRGDVWFEGFDFDALRDHSMRPPIRPKVLSLTDTRNFDRFPATDDFACGSDDSGWDEDF